MSRVILLTSPALPPVSQSSNLSGISSAVNISAANREAETTQKTQFYYKAEHGTRNLLSDSNVYSTDLSNRNYRE